METKEPIAEAITTVIVESEDPLAGLEIVDDYIQQSTANIRFDRRSGNFSMDLIVSNISDDKLLEPFIIVVTGVSSPDVTVYDADGETNDGLPYRGLSNLLVDGLLLPGESVTRSVTFHNPGRLRFTYTTQIFSQVGGK